MHILRNLEKDFLKKWPQFFFFLKDWLVHDEFQLPEKIYLEPSIITF